MYLAYKDRSINLDSPLNRQTQREKQRNVLICMINQFPSYRWTLIQKPHFNQRLLGWSRQLAKLFSTIEITLPTAPKYSFFLVIFSFCNIPLQAPLVFLSDDSVFFVFCFFFYFLLFLGNPGRQYFFNKSFSFFFLRRIFKSLARIILPLAINPLKACSL